jgi:hypothetical protein
MAYDVLTQDARNFLVDVFGVDGAGAWRKVQTLAQAPGANGGFGFDVSFGGPLLAVTASGTGPVCFPCGGAEARGALYAYTFQGGMWRPVDVYAPGWQALQLDDWVATDGTTLVADGRLLDAQGMVREGMVIMQMGTVPKSGYAKIATDGSTLTSSGGGGIWVFTDLLLLALVWRRRRRG